ncbi:MAG: hypothetical protein J6D18_05275 [Erysipelotrichaceae bacterium]|nr:hypothetical protein [Erysipelotrichaceae bacterium]
MSEQESTVDVFYDMEIAQICQHFSKSRNTVDKAVAKLVKDFPEAGYKYKNPETRRITIKAEGVEKLSKYFRKEKHEISTVEVELRFENEKLKAILEEKEKAAAQIEELYKQRLAAELEKNKQTFLLENKSKEEQIDQLTKQSREKDETIHQLNADKSSLQDENRALKEQADSAETVRSELEEMKKKQEEYNSKSFFYRMTHKL